MADKKYLFGWTCRVMVDRCLCERSTAADRKDLQRFRLGKRSTADLWSVDHCRQKVSAVDLAGERSTAGLRTVDRWAVQKGEDLEFDSECNANVCKLLGPTCRGK